MALQTLIDLFRGIVQLLFDVTLNLLVPQKQMFWIIEFDWLFVGSFFY